MEKGVKHFMMVEKVFLDDETALETDTECKTFKLDVTAPL